MHLQTDKHRIAKLDCISQNSLMSCHVLGSSDSFTNFEFVLTNICYELFFIRQTEKKKPVFFFNCTIWEEFMDEIGEKIWWTRYMIRLFLCIFNRFSLPLVHWSERNMVFRVPISSEGHDFKFLSKLIDDWYQFFSTWNKYYCFKIIIGAQHLLTLGVVHNIRWQNFGFFCTRL